MTSTEQQTGRGRGPRPARHVEIDHEFMRATRVRLGKTYTSLAQQIGAMGYSVTSARIGQIEHGAQPSPELFPLLARALGLTETELKS